ncbi:MAG: hypothetical protein MUP44_01250, partial [Anaerolineales bacterium]|nr:hypothetical protein [Anaerolineales bacterium]
YVVYQTRKEADAHAMVTEGRKNPAGGRMDFMLQHMPDWLRDGHITSGAGNLVGNLIFNPDQFDDAGNPVPWFGSRIESVPGGPDQVRGKTASLIDIDEAAFHEMLKKVIVACNPAVAGGGQLHIASSVDAGSEFNAIVLDTADGGPPENDIPEIIETAMKIMGIRWPRGMRTWETASGFQVLELHYTADPEKDPDRFGEAWVEEAAKGYPGGMASSGWRTEMEIDYEAGGGEKVFPFLTQSLSPVFVDSIDPAWAMARMNVFAGYDYGTNNPSAFIVWGIDEQANLHALWELYEPCADYVQHFSRIKRCPYFEKLEYIAADNKIFSKTQQSENGVQSVAQLFLDNGIYISRARQGMDYPIAMRFLSEYWPGGKIGWDQIPPRAFITADCPNLKMEVRGLKFQSHVSGAVSSRKNNAEKLVDKNNHAWDASAYAIDRKPSRFRQVAGEAPRDSIDSFLARAEKLRPRPTKTRGGIICC